MEPCSYPNCHTTNPNRVMPVIKLPTMRTLGVIKPEIHRDLLDSPDVLRRANLSREYIVGRHEEQLADYRQAQSTYVDTDKPTYLIGRPLCPIHAKTYNLTDWMPESEWAALREAARSKGFHIPETRLIIVEFKPLDWEAADEYMELER